MVSIDADVQRVLDGKQFLVVGAGVGKYDPLNVLGDGEGLNRSYGVPGFVATAQKVENGFDLRLRLDEVGLRLYDGTNPTGLSIKPVYTKIPLE